MEAKQLRTFAPIRRWNVLNKTFIGLDIGWMYNYGVRDVTSAQQRNNHVEEVKPVKTIHCRSEFWICRNKEFVCRFGTLLELHSDQGRNFESQLVKDMCSNLGIRKTRTTPDHPQSHGMVERCNQTLATQLSMFVNENRTDWNEQVDTVLMAYRTAVHESTGQTSAMLGHELCIPIDYCLENQLKKNMNWNRYIESNYAIVWSGHVNLQEIAHIKSANEEAVWCRFLKRTVRNRRLPVADSGCCRINYSGNLKFKIPG